MDGEGVLNYESLIIKANAMYKNLYLQGKWNTPSTQEEKIIALEAQIKKMEKKRISWAPKSDQKKAATPDGGKKKAYKECPAWMKKPPKGNLKQVKEWNGTK